MLFLLTKGPWIETRLRSDVLIENMRPGVMDRLGVGYDVLSVLNPGLVYCSVSGFGQHGEHARRPAFDSLLQAAGGLISATGPAEEGQTPVRVGCSIVEARKRARAHCHILTNVCVVFVRFLSCVRTCSAHIGYSSAGKGCVHKCVLSWVGAD